MREREAERRGEEREREMVTERCGVCVLTLFSARFRHAGLRGVLLCAAQQDRPPPLLARSLASGATREGTEAVTEREREREREKEGEREGERERRREREVG